MSKRLMKEENTPSSGKRPTLEPVANDNPEQKTAKDENHEKQRQIADWKYKMYLAMGHVDLLEGRPRAAINKFNNAKEIHFDERIKNAVKKAETLLELKLEEQRERRKEEETESREIEGEMNGIPMSSVS